MSVSKVVFAATFFWFAIASGVNKSGMRIDIQMNPEEAEVIRRDVKYDGFRFIGLSLQGRGLGSGAISTRGNSTVNLPKKSYRIDLDRPESIFPGVDRKTTNLYLVSMVEDPRYLHSAFAYRLGREMNLFFSEFFYVELYINKKSNGIYLAIERPEEAIRRSLKNVLAVARRGPDVSFDIKYKSPKIPSSVVRVFLRSLEDIWTQKVNVSKKIREVRESVFLENYYKYLALNRILMNGDYSRDEIYFTVGEVQGRLKVINTSLWDCDDLFQGPWNGVGIVYRTGRMSLIYEGTSSLDRLIADSDALYKPYLEVLKNLSGTITDDKVDGILSDLVSELRNFIKSEKEIKEIEAYAKVMKRKINQNIILIRDEIERQIPNEQRI